MFDKNDYINEVELSEKGIQKKTRQMILEILNTISKLDIEEINKIKVENIIKNSNLDLEILFLSNKNKNKQYKDLISSFDRCIKYWDDGRFDRFKRHFEKFVKIKLET